MKWIEENKLQHQKTQLKTKIGRLIRLRDKRTEYETLTLKQMIDEYEKIGGDMKDLKHIRKTL